MSVKWMTSLLYGILDAVKVWKTPDNIHPVFPGYIEIDLINTNLKHSDDCREKA